MSELGKIRVYIKDPDGFNDSVKNAAKLGLPGELAEDEAEAILEVRQEKIKNALKYWVECSECVTLQFDLDKKIAKVIAKDEKTYASYTKEFFWTTFNKHNMETYAKAIDAFIGVVDTEQLERVMEIIEKRS